MSTSLDQFPYAVIGAGPAGLTAAYELARQGMPVVIFESEKQAGGIAKTIQYKGFRFDIGGHRFFTKQLIVFHLWQSLLGEDLLIRPRLSRIFYNGRYFDYPLKPLNVLKNIGVAESVYILLSYLWRKIRPIVPEKSLADWVTNRFGDRLFIVFFKTYTEKVWGVACSSLGAQWAAQRIKGLSLRTAVLNMFSVPFIRRRGREIRTLIEQFHYPRLGPGMMWDALSERYLSYGGEIRFDNRIVNLRHDGERVTAVVVVSDGNVEEMPVEHVISTMPLRQLIHALLPAPPEHLLEAADRLRYRDFLTVALILDKPDLFPDNWLYIHDKGLRVGRVQNYKNWSSDMVPDQTMTCVGLEYFCFEGDELWSSSDSDLVEMATRELVALGLAESGMVQDGSVVRMPKAYPMYDEGFEDALAIVRKYLEGFGNLQVIGRNGMHRYNNMDHSMLTAILAVRNLFGEHHDLWAVNTDEEHHETVEA